MTKIPDLTLERALWEGGFTHVAGMDEAGRGALAGPIAVAAVILPADHLGLAGKLHDLRACRSMTPGARLRLKSLIIACAPAWGVGFSSTAEIDSFGAVVATRLAALRALGDMALSPEFVLADICVELGELDVQQAALVKGDQQSLSIAAAAVLAKTARDALMANLDVWYPGYGLAQHKGYGTRTHRAAIGELGLSGVHRNRRLVSDEIRG